MSSICLYFQVHQPYRVKKYSIFDVGNNHTLDYFNELDAESAQNNQQIFNKVAEKCYLPTNKLLLKLLNKHPELRFTFSFSGVFLEQAKEYDLEVLKSFQKLIKTGRVEVLNETYYHSLACIYSKEEFKAQIQKHTELIEKLFKLTPTVFRNTELIYNNELAKFIEDLGYDGIVTEGADHVLDWRSPNFIYKPTDTNRIKVLLKNYKLSDDIAFRFSDKQWGEYPLTVDKFANWVNSANGSSDIINLFMDYETFGEHQWEDTGIFQFLEKLPGKLLQNPKNDFVTPTEALKRYQPKGEVDVQHYISWADLERDLSAWLYNEMQHDAINSIYKLEEKIHDVRSHKALDSWRKLQTSDHFYYMSTKWFNDHDAVVHQYFSPYESPYEAFITYMNALRDLQMKVDSLLEIRKKVVRFPKNAKIVIA